MKILHKLQMSPTVSKISSIGNVVDNIESFVNHHFIPRKCKSCGLTTAIFERL